MDLRRAARSSPRLQVTFDTHQLARQDGRITRDVELRNVVALLPGKSARRIYVTAHYDSLNIVDDGQISAITRAPDQLRGPIRSSPQLRTTTSTRPARTTTAAARR